MSCMHTRWSQTRLLSHQRVTNALVIHSASAQTTAFYFFIFKESFSGQAACTQFARSNKKVAEGRSTVPSCLIFYFHVFSYNDIRLHFSLNFRKARCRRCHSPSRRRCRLSRPQLRTSPRRSRPRRGRRKRTA